MIHPVQPPWKRLKFVDAQTKSSPAVKSAYDASMKNCLQKPSTAPLNYEDAKLVTHFVRHKLNTSSDKLSDAKQEDTSDMKKKSEK